MFDALLRGLFWFALLFVSYNAVVPHDQVTAPAISDVALHAGAFFGLTGLLLAAYPSWPRWACLCALLLYGAGIEVVQAQLPHRDAEWKDLGVDLAGIVVGAVCYHTFGSGWVRHARLWWLGNKP
ncbi:MAG: VanZ family protein [Pseudomonadota bacterium]